MNKMLKGIYGILNRCTNSIYIGQSKNLLKRLGEHKCNLKSNTYNKDYYSNNKSIKKLQDSFNENPDDYEFIILQEEEDNLNESEDLFIEYYRSKNWNVFNLETNKEKRIRLQNPSQEQRDSYKNSKHINNYKEQIIELRKKGKSSYYIANEIGCSHTLICRYLKRFGVK